MSFEMLALRAKLDPDLQEDGILLYDEPLDRWTLTIDGRYLDAVFRCGT